MNLTLKLKVTGTPTSAGITVRAWIDVDNSGHLTHNEEVELDQNGVEWSGTIESAADHSGDMLFIVKYIASPDSHWTLKITSDVGGEHPVFEDDGQTSALEGQIVGALNA
jgi:hypothetical protein